MSTESPNINEFSERIRKMGNSPRKVSLFLDFLETLSSMDDEIKDAVIILGDKGGSRQVMRGDPIKLIGVMELTKKVLVDRLLSRSDQEGSEEDDDDDEESGDDAQSS